MYGGVCNQALCGDRFVNNGARWNIGSLAPGQTGQIVIQTRYL